MSTSSSADEECETGSCEILGEDFEDLDLWNFLSIGASERAILARYGSRILESRKGAPKFGGRICQRVSTTTTMIPLIRVVVEPPQLLLPSLLVCLLAGWLDCKQIVVLEVGVIFKLRIWKKIVLE